MRDSGFTLVELSIVLVIIGLIVGGVLVGRDLIEAAAIRAQMSQIEKYQSAVNTFRSKFNCLPGDCESAAALGFPPRGSDCNGSPCPGQGNGDGIIEGADGNAPGSYTGNDGWGESAGETAMFWVDLSMAQLIAAGLGGVGQNASYELATDTTGSAISQWLPAARIGHGNYVYVWSGGIVGGGNPSGGNSSNQINYYGVSAVNIIEGTVDGCWIQSTAGMSVAEAYAIDTKMDDGFPQTGRVQAMFLAYEAPQWSPGWATPGDRDPTTFGPVVSGDGVATMGSSGTCYDNAGVPGGAEKYSMAQNKGANLSCGLSFTFE